MFAVRCSLKYCFVNVRKLFCSLKYCFVRKLFCSKVILCLFGSFVRLHFMKNVLFACFVRSFELVVLFDGLIGRLNYGKGFGGFGSYG